KLSEIKLGKDNKVSYKFVFKNKTTNSIKIIDVHTSCTCTARDYSKGDIKPNESGFIILTTNLESLKQNQKVDGVIKFNSKVSPFYKVSIIYDKQ
ncbi:MAG: DUF1573 domain-containing protein, partial [Pedobacter sp.]